jgi:GNAT superfamily N-acetyltransferase
MSITFQFRGDFESAEVERLHADAFATRVYGEDKRNWEELVARHSLGWVVARSGDKLVGFVNIVWDGLVHAWIQDTVVATSARGQGIGTQLVAIARDASRDSGCEWLHADFEEGLGRFYFESCGFNPTSAGVIRL